MSEDPDQPSGEPGASEPLPEQQPEATLPVNEVPAQPGATPLSEQPEASTSPDAVAEQPEVTPSASTSQYPPAAEVYIQPEVTTPRAQSQYPPAPEFYAQQPAPQNPYGAAGNAYGAGAPPASAQPPAFPPPPAYGGYGSEPPPQAHPLPLGQAIRELPGQYKRIVLKPDVRKFAAEQGKAEWGIIWLQLLFLFVLQVLISLPTILRDLSSISTLTTVNSNGTGLPPSFVPTVGVIESIVLAVFAPAIFFATVGVQYLVARMFKANGSFKQQAYNQLLFQVPITVVSSLLSLLLIPSLSQTSSLFVVSSSTTQLPSINAFAIVLLLLVSLISFALGIYSIVLNIFSIMSVHRLSGGKASGVVLIPYGVLYLVLILVFCGLFFTIFVAASNAVHP